MYDRATFTESHVWTDAAEAGQRCTRSAGTVNGTKLAQGCASPGQFAVYAASGIGAFFRMRWDARHSFSHCGLSQYLVYVKSTLLPGQHTVFHIFSRQ
jgi:hypothetical protein